MVKISWLKSATDDLKEIFEYISIDSGRNAKNYIKKLKSKTDMLENNPYFGRIVPELKREDLREIIFENYRIVYHLKSDQEIIVLMVHHTSRKFTQRWL